MAFCTNCGAKLVEGALFCAQCGHKVIVTNEPENTTEEINAQVSETEEIKAEANEAEKVEEVIDQANESAVNGEAPKASAELNEAKAETKKKATNEEAASVKENTEKVASKAKGTFKKIPVFVWPIAVLVLAGIIALSILISQKKHTMDLNEYLDVQFLGYNTIATCDAQWNDDFWGDFYAKAAKEPSGPASKTVDIIQKKFKYTIKPNKGLSNGDKVTITWNVDKKYFKKHYGLNIKCEDKTIKVEDLEKITTFNPFDGIKINFSGIDGDGRADYEVISDDPMYTDFDFYISDDYNLSNGDVIKVELQMRGLYSDEEMTDACAEKYNMAPTQFVKKYTVKGLGKYVSNVSELTDKNLKPLLRTADDAITEETLNWRWKEGMTQGARKYIGAYVLTEKNHGDNKVFLVYEANVNMEYEGDTDSCRYYTYIEFDDVSITSDGKLSCDTSYYSRPSAFDYKSSIGTGFLRKTYYLVGFETLEQLNDSIVTGNLARYDSNTNVNLD